MKLEYWTKQLRATLESVETAETLEECVVRLEHLSTVAQQAANDGKTWLPKDGGK